MTDIMSPAQRRKAMQSNRGRTGPERRLAAELWQRGLRFFTSDGYRRLGAGPLPGKPDLIFPSRRAVVFMDGCFWHGCRQCHDFEADCNEYWQQKIARNVERDARTTRSLEKAGWRVLRVWEHELAPKLFAKRVDRLHRELDEGASSQH